MKNLKKDWEPVGEHMILFCPAGSRKDPASHTARQEKDLAKKMTATSGRKCLEQFGRLSQPGLWAKTFAGLLIGMGGWYSTRCKLTWKLKGTKSNRFYFQLRGSTLPTDGIGFGLLPTPTAAEVIECKEARSVVMRGNSPRIVSNQGTDGQAKLNDMARVGLLPTPNAGTSNGVGMVNQSKKGYLQDRIAEMNGKTSQLNPLFVAEMMGFPPDYLELPFLSGEQNQSKPEVMQ